MGIEPEYIIGFKPLVDVKEEAMNKKHGNYEERKALTHSSSSDSVSDEEEGELQIPKNVVTQV
jgi:hypothetical protein